MIFLLPAKPAEIAPVLLSPACFAYTDSSFLTTLGPVAPFEACSVMYASHSARSTSPLLSVSRAAIILPVSSGLLLRRLASSVRSILPSPSVSASPNTLSASALRSASST